MARITDKGLIAKKLGMSRILNSEGNMVAVTLLQVEAQKVTKILTPETDGYHGFQVGYKMKKEKHLSKADLGRLQKKGVEEHFASFREFRTQGSLEGVSVGSEFGVQAFSEVKSVDVTGVTKGKGFQGAVKRWGASIGRMSHGSRFHRRPGSLGQCTTPGRVYKNKKQPGHDGAVQNTVQNLEVVRVDAEKNLIVVKGSVPGFREGYLEVRPTVKGKV